MAVFTLEIEMDNAAFEIEPRREVARILEIIATQLRNSNDSEGRERDFNGNKVAIWQIKD